VSESVPSPVPEVAAISELPPELSSAYDFGVWPIAAGLYDPLLDGQGIPDGTNIFGLFDIDTTNNIAPFADIPVSLAGYTTVSSPAELVPGSYCVLHVTGTGFVEYDYALVMGAYGPIEVTPLLPPTVSDTTAPVPPAVEPGEVYITIVNAGKVEVAAQPVTPDTMTIEGVLLKAHETWYKDGVNGYVAGIYPTYNMYLITTAWGVLGTPFISQGNNMMGSTPVNAVVVQPGDNIIMTTTGAAMAVMLRATKSVNEDEVVVTATSQTFDISTFGYMPGKVGGARVVDSAGNPLGNTDDDGRIVVKFPADEDWDGVVIIEGMAAINVLQSIDVSEKPIDVNARTVFFTVKFDITLEANAIAVPVKLTKNAEVGEQRTIEGALKRFHELYFNDGKNGIEGYVQGAKIWGVEWKDQDIIRPKLARNDELIDISNRDQLREEVMAGDNFLISISTNPYREPIAAYMDIYIRNNIAYGDAYLLDYGKKGETVKTALNDGYMVFDAATPPESYTFSSDGVLAPRREDILTDENGHFEFGIRTVGSSGVIVLNGLTARYLP
jgi:hypothetical protein